VLTLSEAPRSRQKYPPRLAMRNRVRLESEPLGDTSYRGCPGCYRPLDWRIYETIIRTDVPTAEADLDEIVWIAELGDWRIPRYSHHEDPICPIHGKIDWWVIVRTEDKLIVGWGRDVEPPKKGSNDPSPAGRLFERPCFVTEQEHDTLPFGGKWRRADFEKERNLLKRGRVVRDKRQMTLF
jgi:hypothetical protein